MILFCKLLQPSVIQHFLDVLHACVGLLNTHQASNTADWWNERFQLILFYLHQVQKPNSVALIVTERKSSVSVVNWTYLNFLLRAVFKFDGNRLGVTEMGEGFQRFKDLFANDDRGFGYIRIQVRLTFCCNTITFKAGLSSARYIFGDDLDFSKYAEDKEQLTPRGQNTIKYRADSEQKPTLLCLPIISFCSHPSFTMKLICWLEMCL